jgi:hypothetical protein
VEIARAQADVRRVYRSGSVGQVVSGVVWLVAAAVATRVSDGAGMASLFLGGVLIFPVTTAALRLLGGPAALPRSHPMNALALQVAMTVPLGLLVVIVLGHDDPPLFFPAAMVLVGAHYLPFVFLYGMPAFGALAGLLVIGAVALLYLVPGAGLAGAWATGIVLVVAGLLLPRSPVTRHEAPEGDAAGER